MSPQPPTLDPYTLKPGKPGPAYSCPIATAHTCFSVPGWHDASCPSRRQCGFFEAFFRMVYETPHSPQHQPSLSLAMEAGCVWGPASHTKEARMGKRLPHFPEASHCLRVVHALSQLAHVPGQHPTESRALPKAE